MFNEWHLLISECLFSKILTGPGCLIVVCNVRIKRILLQHFFLYSKGHWWGDWMNLRFWWRYVKLKNIYYPSNILLYIHMLRKHGYFGDQKLGSPSHIAQRFQNILETRLWLHLRGLRNFQGFKVSETFRKPCALWVVGHYIAHLQSPRQQILCVCENPTYCPILENRQPFLCIGRSDSTQPYVTIWRITALYATRLARLDRTPLRRTWPKPKETCLHSKFVQWLSSKL